MTRRLSSAVSAIALAAGAVWLASAPATAATCTAGTASDFNGDGLFDTVIADPNATVNGIKGAGLVRVVYGGGKGVAEVSQATTNMPSVPEANDNFGWSTASYDANADGCSDLVVGVPNEDVTASDNSQLVDVGAVYVVYGTPTGVGAGSMIKGYLQSTLDTAMTAEPHDLFGYALKAGTTLDGAPFLIVGVPGEGVLYDGKNHSGAGLIEYVRGTTAVAITQQTAGVPGDVEAQDRFGHSLTATSRYFAVGTPGEAIGTKNFAGGVAVFSHTLTDGLPTPLAGFDQDTAGVAGPAEAGDRFGTSISMTGFRPSNMTYNSDGLIAVGSPGEALGTIRDGGSVAVFRIQPSGALTQITAFHASTPSVDGGGASTGDFFGQRVSIVNTNSSVVTTADTVRLAVGVPGKDTATVKDAGAVQVFRPLDADLGAADKFLTLGAGLPGTATERDYTGIALASATSRLFVGVPYSKAAASPKGALYNVPWTDIDGTTNTGAITYKPGAGGLPDTGESFGQVG
jgi:hypothetical protein